jgi:soluble lytic murein transglycosylase-like protein
MTRALRCAALLVLAFGLAACNGTGLATRGVSDATPVPQAESELQALAFRMADHYEVPRALAHRVIMRESRYNPAARNGPYWGMMQIHPQTARTMGFRGEPAQLLDPETNLRYGLRYLRGAWMVSDGDMDRAVMWYARGYYYEARNRGMLEATGLR